MLWLAIQFPALSLQIYQLTWRDDQQLAISEGNVIVACNQAAREIGVYHGLPRLAALSLSAELTIRPRRRDLEQAALEQLGTWALGFSSQVSLEPPRALVLEAERSLQLFGGAAALYQAVTEALAALGYQGSLCVAPTPGGALMLAAWGCDGLLLDQLSLRCQLAQLPVAALGLKPKLAEDCRRLGLGCIGDVLALPRDGVALRLGAGSLEQLDRLLGDQPDPRRFFVPPDRYHGELELPAEVLDAPALVFAARRLLDELSRLLRARRAAVPALYWTWRHAAGAQTRLRVGSARPEADSERWLLLLRERLARQPLSAPVREIVLDTDPLQQQQGLTEDLFGAQSRSDPVATDLVDRLRARLGDDSVHALALVADHRPERAWRHAEPRVVCRAGANQRSDDNGLERKDDRSPQSDRPLWLLSPPISLRLQDGFLWLADVTAKELRHCWRMQPWSFIGGRERIESGWWDVESVCRDYFTVHAQNGEICWVYRSFAGIPQWYLHGIFGCRSAAIILKTAAVANLTRKVNRR